MSQLTESLPNMADARVLEVACATESREEGAITQLVRRIEQLGPLKAGTTVVLATPQRTPKLRLFWWRKRERDERTRVCHAARCSALLLAGFVNVSGGEGPDGQRWAWGQVPLA